MTHQSPINPETLASLRELQVESGPEVFDELLTIFVTNGARLVSRIKTAAAQNDLPALKKGAHALKGSSASMGALHLSALCTVLDQMEPDSTINTIQQAQQIELEFERAQSFLRAELSSSQS